MKAEIKKQWIEALLSGKYEQGKFKLRSSEGKYCCLGVLTDLAVQSGEIPGLEWKYSEYHDAYVVGDDSATAYLDPRVMEWAGIETYNAQFYDPRAEENGYIASLTLLNDDEIDKHTFTRIAGVIREKF